MLEVRVPISVGFIFSAAGCGSPSHPISGAWGGDTCLVLLQVYACSQVTPSPDPSWPISPALASLEVAGSGLAGTWEGAAGSEGGPCLAWELSGCCPARLLLPCSASLCCSCPLCGLLEVAPGPAVSCQSPPTPSHSPPTFTELWGSRVGAGSQTSMTSPGGAEEA